jgi:hypothetical protein
MLGGLSALAAVIGDAARSRSEAEFNEVNLIEIFIAPQKKN